MKLVLASNSPRRRELLAGLGYPYEVRVLEGIDESYPENLRGNEIASYISKAKADAYKELIASDELIITADTIVCLDERVLGKPSDEAEAISMLHSLSGRTHQVYTGVTLTTIQHQTSFVSCTMLHLLTCLMKKFNIMSLIFVHTIRLVDMVYKNGLAMLV